MEDVYFGIGYKKGYEGGEKWGVGIKKAEVESWFFIGWFFFSL